MKDPQGILEDLNGVSIRILKDPQRSKTDVWGNSVITMKLVTIASLKGVLEHH